MGAVGKSSQGASGGTPDTQSTDKIRNELDSALKLDGLSTSEQRNAISQLQQSMGQTGNEAGYVNPPSGNNRDKLYVNTSKAFNINYYLATGSINSPDSMWQYNGYTQRMVNNDIQRIDSGMKPLTQGVSGFRYMNGDALGRMLKNSAINSSNIGTIISRLESDPQAVSQLSDILKGTNYTHPGYTSISYDKGHSTFDKYPVRLDVTLRQGTNAIVTNNHREHEVLGSRGSDYNFTGNVRVETVYSTAKRQNVKQLVIECYI